MKEKQVVSKQRVVDHGEVFTNAREVNAMLDLVKQETERIDSRFLEPACGTGNFLSEVLERKLSVVGEKYAKSQLEYERYAVLAVSSLYGIDILGDNVEACRERLLEIATGHYERLFGAEAKPEFANTVLHILQCNIVWGDALTLKTVSEAPESIIFAEWSLANGSLMKRRDFSFKELVSQASMQELPLFSDLGEEVFIPTPVREYPLVHFLKVGDAE
ncbi:MAG TPA: SAM-dependent DNA methyltransferase [Anaerolineales bacterium]|nr:SAM-dependent DNA methyltransferase [Anaerolineales bacterium]HRQ91690.1 SAM-dependent DNA methyltransferase [Anaerolineales bacterium]